MKRIIGPALLVCFLLLPVQERGVASQEQQRRAGSEPKWMELQPGVHVVKIWDTIGPQWPQVVLLKLTQTEYEHFLKTPEKYVNDLKVLGTSSTHKVKFCHVVRVKKAAPSTTLYLVMLGHEMDTVSFATSSIASESQPVREKPPAL